jgi:hypothetical protein
MYAKAYIVTLMSDHHVEQRGAPRGLSGLSHYTHHTVSSPFKPSLNAATRVENFLDKVQQG